MYRDNTEMSSYLTKTLMSLRPIPLAVQFQFSGCVCQFFFTDIFVDENGISSHLLASAFIIRPDKKMISVFLTRLNVNSSDYHIYYCVSPHLPSFSISRDVALRVITEGVCRWYDLHNAFPVGFDFNRLHDDIKKLDTGSLSQDYIVRDSCKWLSK